MSVRLSRSTDTAISLVSANPSLVWFPCSGLYPVQPTGFNLKAADLKVILPFVQFLHFSYIIFFNFDEVYADSRLQQSNMSRVDYRPSGKDGVKGVD